MGESQTPQVSAVPQDSILKEDSNLWLDTPEVPLSRRLLRFLQFIDRLLAKVGLQISLLRTLETVGRKLKELCRDYDKEALIRHFSCVLILVTLIAYIVLAVIHFQ